MLCFFLHFIFAEKNIMLEKISIFYVKKASKISLDAMRFTSFQYITRDFYPTDEFFTTLTTSSFNLIVVDALSFNEAVFFVKKAREIKQYVPILFIADTRDEQLYQLFLFGIDDIIFRPYSDDELLFRITSLYRRSVSFSFRQTLISFASFTVDTIHSTLRRDDNTRRLPHLQLYLLLLLLEHHNKFLSLTEIKNFLKQRSSKEYDEVDVVQTLIRLRRILHVDHNVTLYHSKERGVKLVYRNGLSFA